MIQLKVEKQKSEDWLVDESLDQELLISQKQEYDDKKLLNEAMKILGERKKRLLLNAGFLKIRKL